MAVTTFGLGDPVPAFTLPDTDGAEHHVPAAEAPAATVLVVTCNHCPYVIAWNPRLRAVAEDYAPRGVRVLAINANDAERYPADSLEHMRRFVRDQDWPMPYLHDASQEAVRALGGERTPHGRPEGSAFTARLYNPRIRMLCKSCQKLTAYCYLGANLNSGTCRCLV